MVLYKPNKNYDAEAQQVLSNLDHMIGVYSIAVGVGPLLITETWRPKREGRKSFHSKNPPQARDYRTKDKPRWWVAGVLDIIRALKRKYPLLQYEDHPDLVGRDDEHLHVEYDTGDPI